MPRHFRWILPLLLLLAVSLACALTGNQSATPTADSGSELATVVAATLTAHANESQPAPAATSTPAPTETSAPQPQPPLSPGVLKVAYIKDGNVYFWTEGGNTVGLTSTHDAVSLRLSDDGRRIAFLRLISPVSFTYALWAVNTDGLTDARVLVSSDEFASLLVSSQFNSAIALGPDQFEWRPGTHVLAYNTLPYFQGPGYAPAGDLRLVDVDTLQKSTLFDFGQAGLFYYSPDGRQLALVSPDHISLVSADGGNPRPSVLTYPLVGTYSEYQYHPHPIWAADSNSLRVAIPPADTLASPVPPTGLWSIPADGSPPTLLASVPAIPFAWPDNAFAPTLERVAYVQSIGDPTQNQRQLHLTNPDGSGDTVFAQGTSINFNQWTPDSRRFVFLMTQNGQTAMLLGQVTGGTMTIASVASDLQQMKWVDNSRFLYLYHNSNAWELRISDVDGTHHAFIDTLPGEYRGYQVFDFTH